MIAPLVLLLASSLGILIALLMPEMRDGLLFAVPCTMASLGLVAFNFFKHRQEKSRPIPLWVVVDGSNVLHWKNNEPRIETLREVVDYLTEQGFTPGVMFDANAGYLVSGKYKHDRSFATWLGLPEDRIMVVPTGTPADPAILTAARDLGARVVTNDRFRDWAEPYPEVRSPGFLIPGGYRKGKLWLKLGDSDD